MINFILWLVLGGIAGWIASIILGTNKTQSPIMDVILGIVGAFLGGFVASLFGVDASIRGGLSIVGLVAAVIGALAISYGIGMLRKGKG